MNDSHPLKGGPDRPSLRLEYERDAKSLLPARIVPFAQPSGRTVLRREEPHLGFLIR
jgi:hypothetical protein